MYVFNRNEANCFGRPTPFASTESSLSVRTVIGVRVHVSSEVMMMVQDSSAPILKALRGE